VQQSTRSRITLRVIALAYLALLLAVPLVLIFYRSFERGLGAFVDQISTPACISAINLSLTIVVIVVPINVILGVVTALALARGRASDKHWAGRGLLQAVVDLPFAVSPVVVGVSLTLLWGVHGWFGGLAGHGIHVIFSVPGMVLATVFVTLPFVVREVEPVLVEIGEEQEQAAATLGASRGQIFRRITLPAIRWGLAYGVVLTVARALGEFGALTVVAGGVAGHSQTLTLLVHARYLDDRNTYGAYCAATVLMAMALVALLVMVVVNRQRSVRNEEVAA
jgi:sulfate transport system permease protein